jgi:translation elongation factor EF-1beta
MTGNEDEVAYNGEPVGNRIGFRIDPETKKEWMKYVEKSDHKDLSHLIRVSVNREITNEEDSPESVDIDLSGVEDDISEIRGSINKLSQDMGTIRSNTAYMIDLWGDEYDLISEIYDILPETTESHLRAQINNADHQWEMGDALRAEQYGWVKDIQAYFGEYDTETVASNIDEMLSTVDNVGVANIKGRRHMFHE